MIFNDSEAQRKEYAKIGEQYQETDYDIHYKHILKQIETDPSKREIITKMIRIQAAPDQEYIVYDHTWEGHNPIGSLIRDSQTNVGVYGKFEPIFERYIQEDNTFGQRLVSKNTIVSYFIPFTKEAADKLHKLCNDKYGDIGNRTVYIVQPQGGTKIRVNSYNDWANGDFDDLYENGKITTTPQIKTKG